MIFSELPPIGNVSITQRCALAFLLICCKLTTLFCCMSVKLGKFTNSKNLLIFVGFFNFYCCRQKTNIFTHYKFTD
jgi:hypothetical protein